MLIINQKWIEPDKTYGYFIVNDGYYNVAMGQIGSASQWAPKITQTNDLMLVKQ